MRAKTKDLIMFLMQQPLEIEWLLEEYKEKKPRSLDSNAYFHVLVHKLAQVQNPPISFARCKNHLIASYGQIMYLEDNEPMIYKTNAPEEYMMELETIHTKCVKVIEENGKNVYFYRVYRGSHEYNNIEMNKLIAGTVAECKEQGIETATENELKHMAELWEKKHG